MSNNMYYKITEQSLEKLKNEEGIEQVFIDKLAPLKDKGIEGKEAFLDLVIEKEQPAPISTVS